MKSKPYGHVRREVKVHLFFIKSGLDEGQALQSIHQTLTDQGKITGGYSAFARQVRLQLKDHTGKLRPNSELAPAAVAPSKPPAAKLPPSPNPSPSSVGTPQSRRELVMDQTSDEDVNALLQQAKKD